MKTQCPHCKNILAVPDIYKEKSIKCKKCDGKFIVLKFKKPPIVVPDFVPHRQNFITKIWAKSPLAFRTSFLATLGVIAALSIAWYVIGVSNWLKRPTISHPIYTPSMPTRSAKINTTIDATKLTADNVYALIMLFHYGKGLETLQRVRASLCDSAMANINTLKALPVIIEPIASQLQDNMSNLSHLKMPYDPRLTNPSFSQVQSAYIDAMYAEIDVMNELILATKTGVFADNWPRLIDRTNDLSIEASFKLVSLMFQMDSKIAEAVSNLKK